ncbi:MAG: universal stress protein [Deferrisomatales bacterium]
MLPRIRTILYAADLSERAEAVLRYALGLAIRYDAAVVAVHAVEPLSPYAQSMVDLYLTRDQRDRLHRESRERLTADLRGRIERFCTEETEDPAEALARVSEIVVREGHPVDVILREAQRVEADLVVMGSHGHTAVGEVLLGSTAHRVLQRSPAPVLLVRLPR